MALTAIAALELLGHDALTSTTAVAANVAGVAVAFGVGKRSCCAAHFRASCGPFGRPTRPVSGYPLRCR